VEQSHAGDSPRDRETVPANAFHKEIAVEPLTLATLTAAVTVLASEVGKGIASEAGKTAWSRIKALFKWSADPAETDLSTAIAKTLEANQALARQVVEILQGQSTGTASTLVGRIDAEKVIVAEKIDTVNM
jgi:hypothetical protein